LLEQEIITKYFSRHLGITETVELSVGDDAAIVTPPNDSSLVITSDTLNVNKHFLQECSPEFVGHKSLAVNLSDIAAMGAKPLWATLNLSIPEIDHAWLQSFSDGLFSLADEHDVRIIGGDIVNGPLAITLTVIGALNGEQRLLRNGCRTGDLIYMSGNLGDAALGWELLQHNIQLRQEKNQHYFLTKLHCPTPRLDVSAKIAAFSQAAIDTSDGFFIDLQRMLTMSKAGAVIELDKIPLSDAMQSEEMHIDTVKQLLSGGEDYELIFTIKPEHKDELENRFKAENIKITEVGKVTQAQNISLLYKDKPVNLPSHLGFDHFS